MVQNAVRARKSHTKPDILRWTCPVAFVSPTQQPPAADSVTHQFPLRVSCWQWTYCLPPCLFNSNVWVCLTCTRKGYEAMLHSTKRSLQGISYFSFHSRCILTGETGWYNHVYTYAWQFHIYVAHVHSSENWITHLIATEFLGWRVSLVSSAWSLNPKLLQRRKVT